jgi:RNA polymerase sigma factor (sigma-70 family)
VTPKHLLEPARLAGRPLLATQSDERLVDLFRAGSEPAFEAIVSRYRGPLLRYCSALIGRQRAEDAVQQAFVNAYDAIRRDDAVLRLKPWLYRIAHNASLNALRDRALRDEPLEAESAGAERPEVALERRERVHSVLASVQDLPARQRDALLLRELEGRSYEEIAAALGVGGGVVRQLLNRARNNLRAAATAMIPPGLLLRLPPAGTEAGDSVAARVAELTGAAGAGAVASKVAATALVTGAVAGGVAVAPVGDSDDGASAGRRDAVASGARGSAAGEPAPRVVGGDLPSGRGGSGRMSAGRERGGSSGPGDEDGADRSGPSGRSGPGSGDGVDAGSNSGPGSASSGPGSDRSGSSGSGSSGSGSSGSGSSGSGSSDSGSSGSGASGSGSSGSGASPSGSGSSGSGPGSGASGSGSSSPENSGSGSSAPGTSGSDSSGPDSSGSGTSPVTSGTGSSGSGSSGSEPADDLPDPLGSE